jgi:hypothetical protein
MRTRCEPAAGDEGPEIARPFQAGANLSFSRISRLRGAMPTAPTEPELLECRRRGAPKLSDSANCYSHGAAPIWVPR